MEHHFIIVLILTFGFALASILAYFLQKLHLPAILGYLLAGYLIGPYSPGFVADVSITEQLAEIGVIFMLFGVGLHFKVEDLISVKFVALPGAIVQMAVATVVSLFFVKALGGSTEMGLIIGLAISVASTVVVIRLLSENHFVDTLQGRISIGWLVVEDIFTVIILIMLPSLATLMHGEGGSPLMMLEPLAIALGKFTLLAFLMFTAGQRAVNYILTAVARLHSHEIFTLTVLAVIFVIATTASYLFGTSMALGAFISGMVIGKSAVKHQAASNALPLKDIFAIIFFISVGMLFNPEAIAEHFWLFLGILAIILIIKPLTAFGIALLLNCSLLVALTVAILLAQIGEFSFILAEQAMLLGMLPDEGFDILVACALVSISLNPLLFLLVRPLENFLYFSRLSKKFKLNHRTVEQKKAQTNPKAIVVGYGRLGKSVATVVKGKGYVPTVIEYSIDRIPDQNEKFLILFGDAQNGDILREAHIADATYLFSTISNAHQTIEIIREARQLNPQVKIVVFARSLDDRGILEEKNVHVICGESEELEAFLSLTRRLLQPSVHGKTIKAYEIVEA